VSSRRSILLLSVPLLFGAGASAVAEEALDVDTYVKRVLRAHPAARVQAGLESQAQAETKGLWVPPDPRVEYSRGRAHPNGVPSPEGTEESWTISQTIPWPGATGAGVRAAQRAAAGFRAEGDAARWEIEVAARQAFGRLVAARALLGIDERTEADARSLRDLVTRRTELGETREADRIKSSVEWMRQRRLLDATRREAAAAEALVRLLAVEPLPRPLVVEAGAPRDVAPTGRQEVLQRLVERNPELLAARAHAERQRELVSQAKKARLPDLDVAVFRDRELDKSSDGVSFGIRVPLWNANRGEIARAEAASSVASAEAERRRIALAGELEERLRDLDVAGAQVQTLEKEILPSASESLRLARRSYEEGETSLLDLLDAQRTFRDTQREAVESRLALALAVTDIQRLVGPEFDPWR
jgi:outer membrane protein, heavy metal efflux system